MPSGSNEPQSELDSEDDEEWSFAATARQGLEAVYHLAYLSVAEFDEENHAQTQRLAQGLFALGKAVTAVQMVSLLYPADSTFGDWSRFTLWTSVVSCVRIDFLLVRLSLGAVAFYASAALTVCPVLLGLTLYKTLRRKGERKWRLRVFLFRTVLKAISTVLLLPMLSVFLAAEKYEEDDGMFEYEEVSGETLPLAGVRVTGVVWATVLVVQATLYTMLVYDIFALHSVQVIDARAHSKIELFALICQVLSVLSHFLIHAQTPLAHCGFMLIASSGCVCAYLYFLPFYALFPLYTNLICYSVVATSSAAMLLSGLLSNSTCGFLLTVVLPCVAPPLLWDALHRRSEHVQSAYIHDFVNLETSYHCELCVRFATLTFKEKHSNATAKDWKDFYITTLSQLFNRMTKLFPGNMNSGLWEFAYIYGILKDESLARIKLSKTANCKFDLEGGFNQYRFLRMLARGAGASNEEVDYVNFRLMYDKAKKTDEESCYLQLNFWSSLSVEHPSVHKVESLARKINASIARAKTLFSHLVQCYPKSHLALKLYGSFLTDVINDTDKGREMNNRGMLEERELETKSLQQENRFSYFDDSNGIMLISGSAESLGSIVYLNNEAAKIVGISASMVIGMNIASFLPQTIISQQAHDSAMRRFLFFSTSNDVALPFSLFVLDIAGFMVEVHIQSKCLAMELKQYFIVTMRRIVVAREVCLFNEEWVIISHTKEFPCLIGYSDTVTLFSNVRADVLIQNFSQLHSSHSQHEVFMYTIAGTVNELAMRFSDLQFRGRLFHLLYCTSDPEEVERWRLVKPQTQAENFQELGRGSTFYQSETMSIRRISTLKPTLRRPGAQPKGLNVRFDIVPKVFELPETDFKAGKAVYGKVKDAAPVLASKDSSKTISFPAGEVSEASESASEVLDLKDLHRMAMQENQEELAADQQSRVSVAIFSELGQGGDAKKQSGKSIASSAVSSNSSFTSSATAIQLLKVVQTSMTRFKCAFLLTNVVVVCVVIAMVVYLVVVAGKYESVLIVDELSAQRTFCAQMSTIAHDLLLVNTKLLPSDEEAASKDHLQSILTQFMDITDLLLGSVEDFSR